MAGTEVTRRSRLSHGQKISGNEKEAALTNEDHGSPSIAESVPRKPSPVNISERAVDGIKQQQEDTIAAGGDDDEWGWGFSSIRKRKKKKASLEPAVNEPAASSAAQNDLPRNPGTRRPPSISTEEHQTRASEADHLDGRPRTRSRTGEKDDADVQSRTSESADQDNFDIYD